MTTPSPAVGAFWCAFSDAQASLQALPLRERVKVTLDANGIPRAEHLPEPKPRIPSADGAWSDIFEDVTWEADAHE